MSVPSIEFEFTPDIPIGSAEVGTLVPERTADSFAAMFIALLPPSRLWDGIHVLKSFFLAAGDELVRWNDRVRNLVSEMIPTQAAELLPDWESVYALSSDGTDTERGLRIQAARQFRQRFRPVDIQQTLSGPLGLAPSDVDVIERKRAFAVSVFDDAAIYVFFVYRNPGLSGTYSVAIAQEILDDKIEQSHTKGYVIESINFLCDDAHNLCDRDILGV